ncbi:DUF222 domain-containing protein [Georgenia sp. MJ173]|uniref:HNH endonuclease signature motif containing protein n=1 Tax=Georgenia sunbinii TaxID=3117728 RepID=UPI002F26714F
MGLHPDVLVDGDDAERGTEAHTDDRSAVEAVLGGLVAAATRAAGASSVEVFAAGPEDDELVAEFLGFGFGGYRLEPPPSWPADVLDHLDGREGVLGEFLEVLPAGVLLGRLLAAIDLSQVDDYSLVEVVAAHKRMEGWSAARAAEAAAVLSKREALDSTWPVTFRATGGPPCFGGDELALRLGISRMTARRLTGRAFQGIFDFTQDALEAGEIDFAKAQAIVGALEDLPADVALAAQLTVLDRAPGRTLHQVRQDLAAAVIAVDPDGADQRHVAARQERRVNHPRALADGMALMSAVLPAADAVGLDLALEGAARAAKNNGDQRTLDQLRADTLALMGHTALATGHVGPHPETHCTCGCTTTTTTPDTSPSPPAETDNRDGDDPPPAPRAAADDEPDSMTDGTGTAATDPPPDPASRGQLRHRPADGPPHPGHRVPGCVLPHVRLGMIAGGRADIRITVPLHVMLPELDPPQTHALDREPVPVADLEGYGPVPPEVARALAAGGTWRRLVTDPTGTQVLDVGRTRYQPTTAIADHVRERDRTCIRPGCVTPARLCDQDHGKEWHLGGHTSVTNLQSLCKRDHILKTVGAFTVARAADGSFAWTTPAGHGYRRHLDGRVTRLPRGAADALRTVARANRGDRPAGDTPTWNDDQATIDHILRRAVELPVTPQPPADDPFAPAVSHYLPPLKPSPSPF